MKKISNFIVSGIALIVIVGFFLQTSESIPANAKIKIIPSKGYWIPDTNLTDEKVYKSFESGEFTERDFKNAVPSTYGQMKSDTQSKSYRVPESWKTYTDTYVTGEQHSLLTSFFAEKRWNPDGTWNY